MAYRPPYTLFAVTLVIASVFLPDPAVGSHAEVQQSPYDSRQELRETARYLETQLAQQSGISDQRERLRGQLERIRQRLERGDFRPGDMIAVRVQGSEDLSGTFQVEAGRRLRIPSLGTVDLSGVLYAEADSVVRGYLSEYVKTDRIRVRPLMRVAILGAVSNPGYYDFPPSATLSDALMEAGGPTSSSNLDDMRLRREGRTVREANEGRLPESASLAQLGVRRGDQVFVPERGGSSLSTVVSVLGALGSLGFVFSSIF